MLPATDISQDLVLVGGGHSHLAVIKQLGMHPIPGLRVTVVSKDVHTPYSGMLPGLIAGHYSQDECFIDLRRLCEWAGCRLLHSSATRIDTQKQVVHCDNRPALRYDWLSINVGSTPALAKIAGASDCGIAVKPIERFQAALDQWLTQLPLNVDPATIAVIGGGAASVEIILAIQYRAAQMPIAGKLQFQLVTAEDQLLPAHNKRVADYFAKLLADRNIDIKTGHRVERLDGKQLYCADRPTLHSDFTVWAIHAAAPSWLANSDIALDKNGFALVSDTLLSTSHDNIFAAGDCASVLGHNLPKSGVYAVRQGPILAENIRRCSAGKSLRRYRPQRRFLSLLATADRQAVASRGRWFAVGPWVWRWKSRIDRRFMQRFNQLPPMAAAATEDENAAMRCGGCGAKVGSEALQNVLQRLNADDGNDGAIAIEDAAVFTPPAGKQMVQTLDHFRAFIDDPYLVGKIGANHCLGDIYAMGATPDSALALANIPYSRSTMMQETLYQLMRGAADTLRAANTRLLGGHSSEAAELAFGLSVNGYIAPGQALLKSGLEPGQALVLGKPLGTGTLLAANMRHAAKGRWIDTALETMQQSNAEAAAIMRRYGASACTDITGFGLLGHLLEMLQASGVAASLFVDAIPLLPGAEQCLEQGLFSSLHPDNALKVSAISNAAAFSHSARIQILYDPQTAGGLLCGMAASRAAECVSALEAAGYQAAIIGRIDALEGDSTVALV